MNNWELEGEYEEQAVDGEIVSSNSTKAKRRFEQPFSQTPAIVNKDTRLNSTDKVVYGAISLHVWHDDMTCFPSTKRLAIASGVCRRTVQRSLDKLEKAGFIKRTPSYIENGGQGANLYTLIPMTNMSQGECQICHGGGDKSVTPNIRKDNIITVNTVKANRKRLKKASPCSGDNATGDNTGSAGDKSLFFAQVTTADRELVLAVKEKFKDVYLDLDIIKIGNSYKVRKKGIYSTVEQIRVNEIINFMGTLGIEAGEAKANSHFNGEISLFREVI